MKVALFATLIVDGAESHRAVAVFIQKEMPLEAFKKMVKNAFQDLETEGFSPSVVDHERGVLLNGETLEDM